MYSLSVHELHQCRRSEDLPHRRDAVLCVKARRRMPFQICLSNRVDVRWSPVSGDQNDTSENTSIHELSRDTTNRVDARGVRDEICGSGECANPCGNKMSKDSTGCGVQLDVETVDFFTELVTY